MEFWKSLFGIAEEAFVSTPAETERATETDKPKSEDSLTRDEFINFFRHYKGEEHQTDAIGLLYDSLPPALQDEEHPWVVAYRKVAPQPPVEEVVPAVYVSKSDLTHIWNCSENLIKDWEVTEMNACLHRFAITTPERICHFLSQTAHESGGGKWMKELSDGKYLEGRTDIGNTQPGDGPKFKGAGYLQLSGRANYKILATYVDDERVMEGVDYVSTTYPFTSAGAWWEHNRMNALIDSGATVEQVTRRVNGGYNGLADRKYYYNRCLQVI